MSNVTNIDQSNNTPSANLSGLEIAGIITAAYIAAHAIYEGVSKYAKSRLMNKEVRAVTKSGRSFEGNLVSRSRFMNTVTIQDCEGAKHTLRWNSLLILAEPENLAIKGAFEEIKEKVSTGEITKEEYQELKAAVKERQSDLKNVRLEPVDSKEAV